MFTAIAHKNVEAAKGYFSEHLSQNDYYSAAEVKPGRWIGTGAERLGLHDLVTREAFDRLCSNQHPDTTDRLTQRQGAENTRRIFYDFTCSAPKSVSILAVTLQDERLIEAHTESVRIAFRELETFAASRIRKTGAQGDRKTSNLIAAEFLHTSSRALDPQLHTHFTVFNATYDVQETAWKALQAGPMYEALRYATGVYRNELARRVEQAGYTLRPATHGFEIEGVSPELIQRFSKRAQQRDAVVASMEKRLGRKLSNDEISFAVHQSRSRKLRGISSQEVRSLQAQQLSPAETQALAGLRHSTPATATQSDQEHRSIHFALSHVFERRSVVPEHELLQVALTHRLGGNDLLSLKRALQEAPGLIRTTEGVTTQQIMETELKLIDTVNQSCSAVDPLHPGYAVSRTLGEDQRRALYHVLRTSDRITGIRGLAGTGKTTVLKELAKACAVAGVEPIFCAPTAGATEVLRQEGFSAITLASLLQGQQPLHGNHLVVLDEAGAVGIEDMRRLLEVSQGSRVILSGDSGQHSSVLQGDALRLLESRSQFQSGQLTQIRRQHREDYRVAVELAAAKRISESLSALERMGVVSEIAGPSLAEAAAQKYVEARDANRSLLLVAPTWSEIETVSRRIREKLKGAGHLAGSETNFEVFESLSWTQAQKQEFQQYQPGMAIRCTRRRQGMVVGEIFQVKERGSEQVKVCRSDGSELCLDFQHSASFDVGNIRPLPVATGERLLLQANSKRKLINGEIVTVKKLAEDGIHLTDGRIIPRDYRTFTYGYAITSHAAQGKTADQVVLLASTRSLPAVGQEQFYVSISRGRESCSILTDDLERLRIHAGRSGSRVSAVEAVGITRNLLQKVIRRGERFFQRFRNFLTTQTQTHEHHIQTQQSPVEPRRRGVRV